MLVQKSRDGMGGISRYFSKVPESASGVDLTLLN